MFESMYCGTLSATTSPHPRPAKIGSLLRLQIVDVETRRMNSGAIRYAWTGWYKSNKSAGTEKDLRKSMGLARGQSMLSLTMLMVREEWDRGSCGSSSTNFREL